MKLREYQSRSISMLYSWMKNNQGHPCVVMPTGSGKSHVIAELCKDALQTWPETRILMLTHVKELIEQNSAKLRLHWRNAPLGIYSAGIGRREIDQPITFAGIQSVRNKAKEIGHIDMVIIDECHLVSHKEEGGYRKLIADLTAINPNLRIVGYSATPYRLGHGLITDKPALFDDLIQPVSIEELVHKKYLATLRSKLTAEKLDVSGVKKRGGEYIESELQAAVDTIAQNMLVVREVIQLASDRKAWLFFCAGVKHAQNVCQELIAQGIAAECVTGKTPKAERDRILADYKAGKIRAITNANVLTTGFDYPDIDLIAMLRPTMSAGLYVQMAGRGMRVADGKTDCLVLDFAGVVETHGPITNVQPPKKGGSGEGEAPVKICDECHEIVHISAKVCPNCGHEFPEPKEKKLVLRQDDIMGLEGIDMAITDWSWRKHTSRASGNDMIAVTYYGTLTDPPITEYLPLLNPGYAGSKAMQLLHDMGSYSNATLSGINQSASPLMYLVVQMNQAKPPSQIQYKKDGKFYRVVKRLW